MENKPFFVFPNIEPTMAVIESLGFVMEDYHYGQPIYTKTMGGRVCRLGLFYETASWDISDNTFLEFRYDDTKFDRSVHGSLWFSDGFYMGTKNVPTAEQIKDAIIRTLERDALRAKENLLKAKDALVAAYRVYEVVNDLEWTD